MRDFKEGLFAGIPICLGYISVSFAFGMMAQQAGVPANIAVLMSLTNVTSAGQFAGLNLIVASAPYMEIAITTLIINLRYCLMSLSLTQRLAEHITVLDRIWMSFGITDEIFAIAVTREQKISRAYFFGLFLTPYLGWALGTWCGASVSSLLPQAISSAMSVALYGMFIAIILPQARENAHKRIAILLAIVFSCIFTYVPFLSNLGSGWTLILITIGVSLFMAIKFPIKEEI